VTIPEAIEAMRRNVGTPGEALSMAAFADVWDEHEENVYCPTCRPPHLRFGPVYRGNVLCNECHGIGYVSNGNSLRAEELRLLAECGKVGKEKFGYDDEVGHERTPGSYKWTVPRWWWCAALHKMSEADWNSIIADRLAIMDAYADADLATRQEWEGKTWELVPTDVECPTCNPWDSRYEPYREGEDRCYACHGVGRIPVTSRLSPVASPAVPG
jgi:rubredoxin